MWQVPLSNDLVTIADWNSIDLFLHFVIFKMLINKIKLEIRLGPKLRK